MSFLTEQQIQQVGFKYLGENVKISSKASIYNPEQISIGSNTRIDDFTILSGKVRLGRNVHIAVYSNIAGGEEGVCMEDFSGLAYGCHVFSQSDDYSGRSLTNPTIPDEYKRETKKEIIIGKHCIVGACSIILPGASLAEGTAVGAMSMVTKSTEEWSVYFGIPAKKIKSRRRDLLDLERKYLANQ
jgi:galactoside O-acetyltransferase